MSRELRRVALDFDWPLHKPWHGFLNTHYRPCPAAAQNMCFGGETPASRWLDAVARLIALLGEQAVEEPHAEKLRARGQLFPHPYLLEWSTAPRCELPESVQKRIQALPQAVRMTEHFRYVRQHPPPLIPFTKELEVLVTKLAGEAPHPFQGGSVSYGIVRAIMHATGLVDTGWGVCTVCKGKGLDPACEEAYESWRKTPPPEGPGWQVWETVSEGSPISPVFAKKQDLREYLRGEGYSGDAIEEFIRIGWCMTMAGRAADDGSVTMKRDIESLGKD